MDNVTFITTNRGRDELVQGLLENLAKHYKKGYKVIVVTQDDDKSFKRGQLFNIGFLHSDTDLLVLIDNDIRLFYPIPISVDKNPVVPFKSLVQIDKDFKELSIVQHPFGYGGMNIFTREQFIISCGFSNLFFGWGGEDNCIHERFKFVKTNNRVGHISHEKGYCDPKRFDTWRTHEIRKKFDDGYAQTVFTATTKQKDNIKYVNVTSIGVPDNFKYKEWLQDEK